MRAVASCEAFFGRRGLIRSVIFRRPGHLTDGFGAVEHFLDGRFAQRSHAGFAPRIEQPDAVGLLGNQASDAVGDGQNLEDAVAAAVPGLYRQCRHPRPFFSVRRDAVCSNGMFQCERFFVGWFVFLGAVVQIMRTSRCARTPRSVELIRKPGMLEIEQARDRVGASFVCSVDRTRWPVSAACNAVLRSPSRISPTMMMSGSWRSTCAAPWRSHVDFGCTCTWLNSS